MKKKYKNLPIKPLDEFMKDFEGYMKEYDEILKEQSKLMLDAIAVKDKIDINKNDIDKLELEKLEKNSARMSEISTLLWYLALKERGFIDEWYDN